MPIHHSRRRVLSSLGVVLVAAVGLSACARGDGESNGDDSASNDGATQSVAALGFGDADTLLALGIQPSVVAPFGSTADTGAKGVGPWAADAFTGPDPVIVENLGQGFTAQAIEKITSAAPTSIVAVNQAVDAQAKKDLEAIAPTTTHDPKYTDWQVPWDEQIREVSAAVGKDSEGDALVDTARKAFEDYRTAHPENAGKKAAIAMPYAGKLGLYTEGDGRGIVLTELGFTIPEDLQNAKDGSFFVDLSPENYAQLDELDELFILEYGGEEDTLRKNPAFANLDLVKNDKVTYIPQDVGNAMSMPNPLTIPWALDKLGQLGA